MPDPVNSICPEVWVPDIDTQAPVPFLYCNACQINMAPEYSFAALSRKYGLYAGGNMEKVEPLDLQDKPVLIKYPSSMTVDAVADTLLFAGICVSHEDRIHATQQDPATGDDVPTGDTGYMVYSLDYLFDRIPIDCTVFEDDAETSYVYGFNGQNADGELIGNRSEERDALTWFFQVSGGSEWTLYDMIEYLIHRFAPLSGIEEWTINVGDGVGMALDNAVFAFNPENKSLRQCLNELLSPERGFAWQCTWDFETDGEPANPVINIRSITDTAVKIDETVYVPANTDTVDLSEDIKQNIDTAAVTVRYPQEAMFSLIEVRGEPVRVMSTFKLGVDNSNLFPNWSNAQEAEYIAAANDEERAQEQFDPVYQHFGLNLFWNGKNYTDMLVVPELDPDTADVSQWIAPQTESFAYWTFDRNLPLPVKDQPADAAKTKYCKPILFVKDGEKYFISDKYRDEVGVKIGIQPADTFPGIVVKSLYNHSMAKTTFTGAGSDTEPIYNYKEALATVSFATDEVLRFQIEPEYDNAPSYMKKMVIQIDGIHLWLASPDAVIDVDANKALFTMDDDSRPFPTDDAGYYILRDDRATLKSIAKFAEAWYGRQRSIVNIEYQSFQPDKAQPGQILTSVYNGGAITAAGTIVTNVAYDFLQQTTAIGTDFPKLNLRELATLRMRKTAASTSRRLSAMEAALNDIPLRDVSGGGAIGTSSAYNGYFTVIKSTEGKAKVINGGDPEGIAGILIVGTQRIEVPATEIDIFSNCNASLWVYLDGAEYKYALAASNPVPEQVSLEITLSTIASNVFTQQWTNGTINLNLMGYVT